ncbi:MAG: RdgB/HAM1 family non-canonical purine NTP pyrophosphatase [Sphaerochaetaceae bacterium]|nr:RdgB/HAM1 family non-canonical purine NTP pyrophosphatase [Sphaerochaetaceae bacterium]
MIKIILATSNKGKILEFKNLMDDKYEVIAFSDLIGEMDIIEDGKSFKENAIIKAKAVYERIKEIDLNSEFVVISDDSGISVPIFNNEPGIYSARYAGKGASDKQNLNKLIDRLKESEKRTTDAYYTACITMIKDGKIYTVHGWMHGSIIDETRGDNGFGYDPMFIPSGYDKTLGELNQEVKKQFSHRSLALENAKKILNVIL